ncbi:MAG: flagellin [Alphaproteobacteria bacterium]
MALNVISNLAASVAHRNLAQTDMEASRSLAKLSSGQRVISAKDDAASLAIGSRLNAEVAALRQVTVNATQAISMLQIADGAMSQVNDILVRMKVLSVQAGSGQFSNTERSMLDAEYQALLLEVDRIAQDTEFNGNAMVNGSSATTATRNTLTASSIEAADGFASINFDDTVAAGGDVFFTIAYDSTTNVMTVSNLSTGESEGINIGATAITGNNTQNIQFNNVGTTIVLNSAFDKTSSVAIANTVAIGGGGGAIGNITLAGGTALLSVSDNAGTLSSGATTDAVLVTFDMGTASATGTFAASATGAVNLTVANGTDTMVVNFDLNTAFNSDGAGGTLTIDALNHMVSGVQATSNNATFSFKLGTGNVAGVDTVSFAIGAVSNSALNMTGTDITTITTAETASTRVTAALDLINVSRANIGANQNRLEFAAANLAVTIENSDAARSDLLDLDVAAEMTAFTSKQILMQAGVSMLAQANQMPQNLLRLFQ